MGRRSEDDVVDELGDSSVGRPFTGRRREDATTTENDFVRVDFANGAATILDKRTGVEYAGVFLLEDAGDVGDEYNYSPPATDERVTSASATDVRVRAVDDGPLTTAIEVSYTLDVPESAAADRRSRSGRRSLLACVLQLRIRRGSGAVECRLRITNTARDHRLRVLCATGASRVEHHRSDTAFDVITRPSAANGELTLEGRELAELPVATAPMQSFVDAGDEARGAVVVADGLPEFEVVHAEHAASIAVTLLRCVGDLSRDDLSTRRGHAGPGLSTPGAQCPGTHEFALTFVPRGTPPGPASLYALARAALLPPRVHQAAAGDGSAPARHSFWAVEAAAENAPVLSACKLADDRRSAIMRFFNPSDAAATGAALVLPPLVAAAYSTDLLERRGERRSVSSGRMPLDIPPHKIATVELVLPERGRMDA
jgi:alpha-mannosidase